MDVVKKVIMGIFIVLAGLFLFVCALVYFNQERIIFFPERLPNSYVFTFDGDFEEKYIKSQDGIVLHGILFKSDTSRGIIYYLHGNAGSVRSWGEIAEYYTELGYDLFMLDYRGYGKSGGEITSEKLFLRDVEIAYDYIVSDYAGKEKIILGYSIGTGSAAWLVANEDPDLLILQAPYYSLIDMKRKHFPFIPDFLMKYTFKTNEFIKGVKAPILIFHGEQDEVIPYESSIKLKKLFKEGDKLITLKDQWHNGMSDHPDYQMILENYLRSYKN